MGTGLTRDIVFLFIDAVILGINIDTYISTSNQFSLGLIILGCICAILTSLMIAWDYMIIKDRFDKLEEVVRKRKDEEDVEENYTDD